MSILINSLILTFKEKNNSDGNNQGNKYFDFNNPFKMFSIVNPFKKIDGEMAKKYFKAYENATKDGAMTNTEYASSLDNTQRILKKFIKSSGNAKLTQEDFNKALIGSAVSFGNIGKSITKFIANAGLYMGITAAISLAVGLISKGIDALVVTQEELEEAATSSTNAYEETKKEIEELNEELESNNKKVQEINSLGHLSLTEKTELANLEEANKKLERQIKLKNDLVKDEARQAASDVGKTMDKYSFVTENDITGNMIDYYKNLYKQDPNVEIAMVDTNIPGQIALYEKYNNVLSITASSLEECDKANQVVESSRQNLVNAMDEIESSMLQMEEGYQIISEMPEKDRTTLDKYVISQYEQLQKQYLEIQKVLYPTDYYGDKFNSIFENEDIEITIQELERLAKVGKLEDYDFSGLTKLNEYLTESGLSIQDLKDYVQSLLNTDTSRDNTAEHLEDIKSRINDIDSANLNKYSETLKEVYKIENDTTFFRRAI